MKFFNNNFYPENFILIGSPKTQQKQAEKIISEATRYFPEKFDGNIPFFVFDLRYYPPFDKGFSELKRLQAAAAQAAGRRSDFNGYIIIDISNYLNHDTEHYFRITLEFLIDMNYCWKYIFLVDNKNITAEKAIVSTALNILLRDVTCEVKEYPSLCEHDLIDEICKEKKIFCSAPVKNLLSDIMDEKIYTSEIISAFITDISGCCGYRITMKTIKAFFQKRDSVIKYILAPKQYNHLVSVCQKGKEDPHEYTKEI